MEVRVRFAPSPTGHLHIGSARTAIFNWLYARHTGGKFLLRIEDTDPERSRQEFTEAILEGLRWLGLLWDEEPVFQSKRLEIYRKYAYKLLEEGKAYYCSCTPQELEEMRQRALRIGAKPRYDGRCRNRTEHPPDRPKVIRFKSEQRGITVFEDVIQGKITYDNSELDDLIILRSDGTPTYNFSCVIDDYDMKISHTIRGADHINNTPRQLQIYQALGWEPPKFAHHPLVLGPDKSKLSKRHGATSLLEYQEMGFLPEALINFLVRIGWSWGDQEIFRVDELIKLFDIKDLNRSPGIWNYEKLLWINGVHIRNKPLEELAEIALAYFKKAGYQVEPDQRFLRMVELYRVRVRTLKEMVELCDYLFIDEPKFDPEAKEKYLTPEIAPALYELGERLERLDGFDSEQVKQVFEEVMTERGLKLKQLAQPVRVALTGKTVSPGLFEVIELLGTQTCARRLKKASKTTKK